MKKHILFVFMILFSVVCPTSLTAAVTEEYKSIDEINQEQASAEVATEPQVQVVAAAPMVAAAQPADTIALEAVQVEKPKPNLGISLTPMVGASVFAGAWSQNIRNQYSLGLALEIPVSRLFSFEIEGGYGNYLIAYSSPVVGPVEYQFNQFLLGGNAKVYFTDTRLRPYIGAGLMAVDYQMFRLGVPYQQIIGSADLMAGLDLRVSDSISIGGRASWLIPLINRPMTETMFTGVGAVSGPGFEEPGAINTNFYRLMGTVTVKL